MAVRLVSKFIKKWGTIVVSIAIVVGSAGIIKYSIKDIKSEEAPVKIDSIDKIDSSDSSNNDKELAESNNDSSENEETNANADSKVNYDNFLSIQMGMTYEEVKDILGEGKEESSNETNGIKIVMYSWRGNDSNDVSIMMRDDIVVNKDQAGLLDMDAQITLDNYNKIQNGMTYNQVQEILGEGQMISESEFEGTKCVIYEYVNKDGSKANFTFTSDSLIDKAQLNLD